VLGSAGPDLLRQTAESLAGRIAYPTMCSRDCARTRSRERGIGSGSEGDSPDRTWRQARSGAFAGGERSSPRSSREISRSWGSEVPPT
jgi:hypothetical protein